MSQPQSQRVFERFRWQRLLLTLAFDDVPLAFGASQMIYAVVRSSEMLSVSCLQWTSLSQQGVAWMVCLTILTGRFCMTWWAAKDLANADGTGLGSLETCHSVEGDRARSSSGWPSKLMTKVAALESLGQTIIGLLERNLQVWLY